MLKLTQKEVKTILASTAEHGISLMYSTEEEVDGLIERLEDYAGKEETWLTRLEDEARELHDRLWKLYDFQSTEAFKKLDTYDQLLLSMQYNNMHAYLATLNLRLNKAKTNV